MWIEHIIKSLFIKIILCYTPHNKMILINVNIFIRTEKTLVFLMYISTLWNKTFSWIHAYSSSGGGKRKNKQKKNKNKVN
jgi:hypothetical protein